MPRLQLLLVDDEPNILSTLRRALEIEDYAVEVAGSGAIALEKAAAHAFDGVLLDVMMPEMDGLTTLGKLKVLRPELPVIMMSGNATLATAVQATRLGACDFLEKPLTTDKVLITIRNALKLAELEREADEAKARARAAFAMIGTGPKMKAIFDLIRKAAPSSGRVLITGENGTGKELVARAIHEHSKRAKEPFIKLNCAAIPSELIESELFGHEKGSFTGATQQRRGKFEQANGGTLFLDEIGDMNAAAQAKVLRVLQEGELERVGGSQTITVDVRVIAATNKNLKNEISAGRFREDLFYRLNVVPIELPPLRDHREDVPQLVEHFLKLVCAANDRRPPSVTREAVSLLLQYEWPGNVRELRNAVERLVILSSTQTIGEEEVQAILPGVKAVRPRFSRGTALRDLVAAAEREFVIEALEANHHHIANTARELGLERSHLYKKMRALGVKPRGDGAIEGEGGDEGDDSDEK
jgi:DNA-binding NtrC family response regulator